MRRSLCRLPAGRKRLLRLNAARTVNELISAVSMAMDIEEGVKLYHGWRVAIIAAHLTKALGSLNAMENFYAGLIHDVGGVGLPHHLVTYLGSDATDGEVSEGPLNAAVISHPLLSAEIVSSLPGIDHAARAVLDHHESWDGHGFPRGLHGHEISIDGQILNAADTVDLMLRTEPPPSLLSLTERLRALASTRLCPDVVEALVERLGDGLYDSLLDSRNLAELFDATRANAGEVPVERGTDAIGVTLDVLSRVVDNKHPYTIGHSRRVARYALLIGIAMGLEHSDLTLLKWAALVRDVGKLSVPTQMLDKPSAPSLEERQIMEFHASYTFDIVSMITDLRSVASVASSHHESYDGTGYPLGWAGEDIPPGARIIAVADAFDAMTSQRPYRVVRDTQFACDELRAKAGVQFDPDVAEAALPVLRNLGLVLVTE